MAKVAVSTEFESRMRTQCEKIVEYRQTVLEKENRLLSLDQAAKEWIELYADSF